MHAEIQAFLFVLDNIECDNVATHQKLVKIDNIV